MTKQSDQTVFNMIEGELRYTIKITDNEAGKYVSISVASLDDLKKKTIHNKSAIYEAIDELDGQTSGSPS